MKMFESMIGYSASYNHHQIIKYHKRNDTCDVEVITHLKHDPEIDLQPAERFLRGVEEVSVRTSQIFGRGSSCKIARRLH